MYRVCATNSYGEKAVAVPFASALHGYIVGIIYRALFAFVDARQLGEVFGDGVGYLLSRNPDTVRGPGVSFISDNHVPKGEIPDSVWPVAPDLAVEIVSTNDRATEINDKVQQYLAASVPLVWVVWPKTRTVTIYTPDESPRDLTTTDTIDGMDMLPGFSLPVAELFTIKRKRM